MSNKINLTLKNKQVILKERLHQALEEWKKEFNITTENIIYSDGEYDPDLDEVIDNICIYR